MWMPCPEKEKVWVKARYKRLQNFCYYCRRLGHDQRCCSSRADGETDRTLVYGSWMSAPGARNLKVEIVGCNERWEEIEACGESVMSIQQKKKLEERRTFAKENKEEPSSKSPRSWDVVKEDTREETEAQEDENREVSSEEGKAVEDVKNRTNMDVKVDAAVKVSVKQIADIEKLKKNTESPKAKADLSKAIVVYGNASPISEVALRVEKINLKRGWMEGTEQLSSKRRKLIFDNCTIDNDQQKEGKRGPDGRRNVRTLKRRLRKEGVMGLKGGYAKDLEARVANSMEQGDVAAVKEQVIVVNAERDGGWPLTATRTP